MPSTIYLSAFCRNSLAKNKDKIKWRREIDRNGSNVEENICKDTEPNHQRTWSISALFRGWPIWDPIFDAIRKNGSNKCGSLKIKGIREGVSIISKAPFWELDKD